MLLPSAVEALRGAGFEVDAADVAHVGPTVIEHISVHGRYYYDLDRLPKGKGLRPARRVAWSPSPDRPRPTGPVTRMRRERTRAADPATAPDNQGTGSAAAPAGAPLPVQRRHIERRNRPA